MTVSDGDESRRRALDFLLSRIDYEKSVAVPYGEQQYKLDRMRELLDRLDRPDRRFRIVHIAGTKGKGSTAAMIAAMLTRCGHSCGLFTSPHLERVEERFTVDGQACDAAEFTQLIERVRPIVAEMDERLLQNTPPESGPTYFELTTALALLHFADRGVEFAVLEVGMGGRLDSTNVCRSDVSVVTSISLDHTKQLGDTLAKIAWEKAGIIKPGVPVVSGVTDDEARVVVEQVAGERGCRFVQLERDFRCDYRPPRHLERAPACGEIDFTMVPADEAQTLKRVAISLPGRHQAANAAVALAVRAELIRQGRDLPEAATRAALAELVWPARVEVVSRRPCIVFDAAHNAASMHALLATLEESFAARRRILIFATTQEKDVRAMLAAALPKFDHVILTRYRQNSRGVPVEELVDIAQALPHSNWQAAEDAVGAWRQVRELQPSCDDLICVTGSFFILPQMQRAIAAAPIDESTTR